MGEVETEKVEVIGLEEIKDVKDVPRKEYYVSGHRTCRSCDPAYVMRLIAKAAGSRTIVIGATGCMYVANTSYFTTPWAIPWMHTQLGAIGPATLGTAAGLKALMRKNKLGRETINVIGIAGDGGTADIGLSGVSGALAYGDFNFLIVCYDNESYANTGIQASSLTPWGALTTFTPTGTLHRVMSRRHKKNIVGLMAAGHPNVKYLATACPSDPLDLMTKVRRALAMGGPTFLHILGPCPKGWDFPEEKLIEVGKLAIETGYWPLYEIVDRRFKLTHWPKKRRPVREYLRVQGRFSHLTEEDIELIQRNVDEMWDRWLTRSLIPIDLEK
ncbi:MAG: thiamine pyrophosphate-dependent enzyme [Candidatus Geothermarchaeales archaeon]